MSRWRSYLPKLRHLALREAMILLCAAALGLGWSLFTAERYLPTMDGSVYAMDPTDNSLFMVLSKDVNNSLVHIDYEGNLLHYAVTETNEAFENLVILEDTIYAVRTTYDTGKTTQALVSMSMDRTAMRVHTLLELSELPEAAGITWTGAYLPLAEQPEKICLGGISDTGNGYLLHWDLASGSPRLEKILQGETIYKLKYVDEGHYVWIDRDGHLGQYQDGVRQQNLLHGLAKTPNHISTYQEYVFVSDSRTGDIYEVSQDGSVRLHWRGTDEIRQSGHHYRDITIYTTSPDSAGEIEVIGLCPSEGGGSNVVEGPKGTISTLRMGAIRVLMILQHSWIVALTAFLFFSVLIEILRAILRSPRMAVRLGLCELVMAGVLLGAVTGIQYQFYQNIIREDAEQKLQLLCGNLADLLTSQEEMTNEEVRQATLDVLRRVSNREQYIVNVVWLAGRTAVMGYDSEVPNSYEVSDVKSLSYASAVESFLTGGKTSALTQTRNAVNISEYIYIQRISQGDWTGCVTVAQTENDILAGRSSFWGSMAPILASCPFLFAALILITRYLLKPLDVIQESLEEFYKSGGGNQMDLARIPKTELYQVGQVFNQLSIQTKVQFNTLSTINSSYVRLVPDCLLKMLHKKDVLEVTAGEYAEVDGALLMLVPETPMRTAALLERILAPAAEHIQSHGGMIIDYDEGLGSITAIFTSPPQALESARHCLADYEALGEAVMTAVFNESVEIGVFGAEKLLYPVAVSAALHRRQDVLSLLSSFGAVLVSSGEIQTGSLRLLGWDGKADYYEDPSCRPGVWQAQWKEAAPLWREAVELFRRQEFAQAMRKFARVLRLMPGDRAARWYLFRCESLRDHPVENPDTGLLFDGRDHYG